MSNYQRTCIKTSGRLAVVVGSPTAFMFDGFANSVFIWNGTDGDLTVNLITAKKRTGSQFVPVGFSIQLHIGSDRFHEFEIIGTGTGDISLNGIKDEGDVQINEGHSLETRLVSNGGSTSTPISPTDPQIEGLALSPLCFDDGTTAGAVGFTLDETTGAYTPHYFNKMGTPLAAAPSGAELCFNSSTGEECRSYTFDMTNGDSFCFPEIIAKLAAANIITNDIIGFEFTLKPINGDAVGGGRATTAHAISTGGQGERDLDGGGQFKVEPQRLPNGNFVRLSNQCFSVDNGSVAVLAISYVL